MLQQYRPTCPVASIAQVGAKVASLVCLLPHDGGAVLVVGVSVVVVCVHPCQHGAAGWTAHGCGHKCIVEVRPTRTQQAVSLRHEVHGACTQGQCETSCKGTSVEIRSYSKPGFVNAHRTSLLNISRPNLWSNVKIRVTISNQLMISYKFICHMMPGKLDFIAI